METREEEIRRMIQGLEAPYKELSEWETNFFESVSDQFDRRGTLTDEQYDKLVEIFERKA